jgi:hypothetical protein
MKTSLVRIVQTIFVVAFLVAGNTARTQGFTVTTTLHEDGTGTLMNSSGFNSALPSSQQQDPGPGGLANALTFDLLRPPGLAAGDLFLIDPTTLLLSDVIRFNPQQGNGSAVFYSALGGSALADIGFPTANYQNTFSLNENLLGPTSYTPVSGQPGFVAGAAGPVTYVLYSGVPEYANTAVLMMLSLTGLFLFARIAAKRGLIILNRS